MMGLSITISYWLTDELQATLVVYQRPWRQEVSVVVWRGGREVKTVGKPQSDNTTEEENGNSCRQRQLLSLFSSSFCFLVLFLLC